MSSKTYIICWDGALDNCKNIESQLGGSDIDYKFFNVSSYDYESPNWERSEDIRYYGHFYNALSDFLETDKEVFIFNAGDVPYHDYVGYTKKVETLFAADSGVAVFAPSFDNDGFSGSGSFIQESVLHSNLYLATHTNGIIVALSRAIVQLMYDFYLWGRGTNRINFETMKSGWGLDTVYNSFAIYLNKKIYRDHLVMHHPSSSSYDHRAATQEMNFITDESKHFAGSIGMDPGVIHRIQKIIVAKSIHRQTLSVKDVYLNLKEKFAV
jgi:hypothetical protein